jgi:hypothetical protein
MTAERDPEDKGFKVNDRRLFTPEAEAAPAPAVPLPAATPPPDAAPASAAPPDAPDLPPAHKGPPPGRRAAGAPLPAIDFATFILSLTTSALYHFGELPHPDSGQTEANLPLAKQSIDIIAMLRDKTRGNLTDEEARLIDSLLYDLRIKYVQATKK